MKRPPRTAIRQAPAAKRLVILFALLAFFVQSFAVQTHIHPQSAPLSGISASTTPAPAPLKSQDPGDQASCRLCQALVHSGAFVTPSASSLLTTLSFVAAAFAGQSLPTALLAPAFAWQGRAPPRR